VLKFQERRARRRYKLQLTMWFCAWAGPRIARWTEAEVVDIGAGGVRFRSRKSCPVGADVKIAIDWPVKRDGRVPMALVATGIVVHNSRGRVGVRFVTTQLIAQEASENALVAAI
jgi:hypothetical protein